MLKFLSSLKCVSRLKYAFRLNYTKNELDNENIIFQNFLQANISQPFNKGDAEQFKTAKKDLIAQIRDFRPYVALFLPYYETKLSQLSREIIEYATDDERLEFQQQLQFTYYLMYLNYRIKRTDLASVEANDMLAQMDRCRDLLELLGLQLAPIKTDEQSMPDIKPQPESLSTLERQKALVIELSYGLQETKERGKYFGMLWARQHIQNWLWKLGFSSNEMMAQLNSDRLSFAWGTYTWLTLVQIMQTWNINTFNMATAEQVLSKGATALSYASWLFLGSRLVLNLSKLTYHVARSDEELDDSICTSLEGMKYKLVNDILWTPANFLSAMILVGAGPLVYVGNFLTMAVLLLDIAMSCIAFEELKAKHRKDQFVLNKAIDELKKSIAQDESRENKLKAKPDLSAERLRDLHVQLLTKKNQLKDLEKIREKEAFEYKFACYAAINDIVFASGTFVSFGVCCLFLMPAFFVASAALPYFTLVGAALCFYITAMNKAVRDIITISETYQTRKQTQTEIALFQERYASLRGNAITPAAQKNQAKVWTQLQSLHAQSNYERQLMIYQGTQMIKRLLFYVFIPPIVVVSFIFMPPPVALLVTVATLVMAFCINQFMQHALKPTLAAPPHAQLQESFFEKNVRIEEPILNADEREGDGELPDPKAT